MMDFYQSQTDMRAKRHTAMQRGVIAVLDVGTSKMTCLVLRIDMNAGLKSDTLGAAAASQNTFRVIGAATTRARGMRFGEIVDMPEAERAMRTVVQMAQKMANMRVDHVIVSLAGGQIESLYLSGAAQVDTGVIGARDIGRALADCDTASVPEGRFVLHAHPVGFGVDGHWGYSDPLGQAGAQLDTMMHVVTVKAAMLHNLMRCLGRCDLELAGVCAGAYVAGLSMLTEIERETGAACIDIGGATTSISVFAKKNMLRADTVRLGGDHITHDLMQWLNVSQSVAEKLKTMHGGCVAMSRDDHEKIDVLDEAEGREGWRRTISRADLIGIIRPRAEEILEDVRLRLDAMDFDQLPVPQIILVGGASQLPGIDDLARRILGQHIRPGTLLRVPGLPLAATGPGYAAAVGLCLYTANPAQEAWDYDLNAARYSGRSLKNMLHWMRDYW